MLGDHLRLWLKLAVQREQVVVDHVAVVCGDLRRGPHRVQNAKIGLRHDLQRAGGGRLRLCAGGHECGQHERSEEHTSELQSLMRISYAVFCLKKKKKKSM